MTMTYTIEGLKSVMLDLLVVQLSSLTRSGPHLWHGVGATSWEEEGT